MPWRKKLLPPPAWCVDGAPVVRLDYWPAYGWLARDGVVRRVGVTAIFTTVGRFHRRTLQHDGFTNSPSALLVPPDDERVPLARAQMAVASCTGRLRVSIGAWDARPDATHTRAILRAAAELLRAQSVLAGTADDSHDEKVAAVIQRALDGLY